MFHREIVLFCCGMFEQFRLNKLLGSLSDFSRHVENSTENLTDKPGIQSLSPARREI